MYSIIIFFLLLLFGIVNFASLLFHWAELSETQLLICLFNIPGLHLLIEYNILIN